MNVLILTTHLNPGGLARYVLNLSTALNKRKNNVWVACSGGEWVLRLAKAGVGYKSISVKTKSICSLKLLFAFLSLSRLVKQQNFDVIHCNTRVTQLLGFLLYRRFAIPYIAAYHGFYRSSLARKKIKLSGLRSIAVSKAVKDHLVKDLAIEAEKIRVVYNGIDSDEFLAREGRKNDRGFKDSDFLIGILGRISEEKGHFLAVDALSELISRYPNVYLLISGKGRLESKLKAYIDDKGLEKRVRFLECSANNFLDIIDLLTMPSRKEGFGYSILEAFIKGVPVVGYNTGGIAEIIRDRENGCLFYRHNSSGLAEAIEEVMVNASLRDKIIKHGRQDVLKFSTVQMAMATEKVYREVCR